MKLKNIFIIFIILINLLGNTVLADISLEEDVYIDEESLQTSTDITSDLKTYSKHIICIERTTEEILFEKDAYTQTAMASTTKIMTAIIVLENCDLNEEVSISKKAANTGGSTLGISEGTKISMQALLYGLMLRSGNDCAVAIAEHIGGSVEGFAQIMNNKAKELNLKNTNFVTPHGLDSVEHYTTAYDLAILTNYALNNEKFKEIVGTKQITEQIGDYPRSMINTNELLGVVNGVYGVKTGFTGNAGRCLVTACKRNDLDIIVVVLGADTKKIRGLDSKNVIEYVFENYEMVDTESIVKEAMDDFEKVKKINILKSNDKIKLELEERKTYRYPVNKNEISNLKTAIYCVDVINSPVLKGAKIGNLQLKSNDKILYSIDIVLSNDINRMKWNDYLNEFLINFKKYYCF